MSGRWPLSILMQPDTNVRHDLWMAVTSDPSKDFWFCRSCGAIAQVRAPTFKKACTKRTSTLKHLQKIQVDMTHPYHNEVRVLLVLRAKDGINASNGLLPLCLHAQQVGQ